MCITIIDKIYCDNLELLSYLDEAKQPSLRSQFDDTAKKVLVLSIGSFFESEIEQLLKDFFHFASNGNNLVISFIKIKAMTRQYHSYFKWDEYRSGANTFFSLFGEDFKIQVKADREADNDLDQAISSFLELGNLRNKLAHIGMANVPLEQTTEDIYNRFKQAEIFITYMHTSLHKSLNLPQKS